MTASTNLADLIHRHWVLANARDWDGFARLLHPGLVYEVPQTRERSVGAEGYLDLFRTWPQPWRANVQRLVADGRTAVCQIDFVAGDEHMTGIGFFDVEEGLITRVTDWWPEPYDPPPRLTPHLVRVGPGEGP